MGNIVRKVTIMKFFTNQLPNGQVVESPMAYKVDSEYAVEIDGVKVRKRISQITETETHLLVYLKSGDEYQLWNKIPKNEMVIIEYKLD